MFFFKTFEVFYLKHGDVGPQRKVQIRRINDNFYNWLPINTLLSVDSEPLYLVFLHSLKINFPTSIMTLFTYHNLTTIYHICTPTSDIRYFRKHHDNIYLSLKYLQSEANRTNALFNKYLKKYMSILQRQKIGKLH